jgi:hypothetical protein
MMHDELLSRSALELAASIRAKQVSPVEIAEATLARIDALNPRLNAFCLVAADVALNAAREAEIAVVKGEPLGPLHGVPFSIRTRSSRAVSGPRPARGPSRRGPGGGRGRGGASAPRGRPPGQD